MPSDNFTDCTSVSGKNRSATFGPALEGEPNCTRSPVDRTTMTSVCCGRCGFVASQLARNTTAVGLLSRIAAARAFASTAVTALVALDTRAPALMRRDDTSVTTARMPMIAMTTMSSTSVKARCALLACRGVGCWK